MVTNIRIWGLNKEKHVIKAVAFRSPLKRFICETAHGLKQFDGHIANKMVHI